MGKHLGSLEVKLPTMCTDGKAEVGRVRDEKGKERRSEKREDPGARKSRKVAKHCSFLMFCASRRVKK